MTPWVHLLLVFLGCGLAGFVVRRLIRVFVTILRQPPHLTRRQARTWAKLRLQEPNLRIRINGQVFYLPHLEILKLCASRAPKGAGWGTINVMPNGKDGTPPQFKIECGHGTTYHCPIELEMKSE